MHTPHAISTSKSTVMHASLAHLSPELKTLDYITRNPHTTATPNKPVLPTEVLFLIREWLLPAVTAQLIQRSKLALASYERSLRDLLCPDCLLYNLDIFGPDIWEWEQFSGPCSCRSDGDLPRGYYNANSRAKQRQPLHQSIPTSLASNVDPKQFLDAEHWLEWYLSCEAALRIERRGHEESSASAAQLALTIGIWDAVASVLREFNCEAIREPEDRSRAQHGTERGQIRYKRDVKIIPLRHPDRASDTDTMQETSALICASRDLGLLVQHDDPFDTQFDIPHIPPASGQCRLRWPSVSSISCRKQDAAAICGTLLRILFSIVAACLAIPLTFTTVALTILCFYSRPQSFRII